MDLAIPIGLLGLHVGLCGIQLGLLLVERLLGCSKIGIRLVKFRLEGIELTCRGILGSLGIRYLLLEVGYLGLGLVDGLLGLLGVLLRRMDGGLGIDPCLLGGLDLLVCVLTTGLGRLVGRRSILGRLRCIGLLRRRGIICRLRIGELLVGSVLGGGSGLNIRLGGLGVGERLVVCGLGISLCGLGGIQDILRRGKLLVRLIELVLGEIHGCLGILHGLLGHLLKVCLNHRLVVRRRGRLGERHGLHDRGQHETCGHGHGDRRLHDHFLALRLVFAHIEVLLPIGGSASPATIRQAVDCHSGLAAAAIASLRPEVSNSRNVTSACTSIGYVAL